MTVTINGQGAGGRGHPGAEQLLERLNEPRTLEALNRLLDHAELLAFSAASLDGLVRRSDVIADNVAASVAELRGALPAQPAIDAAALGRLLQQLPQLIALSEQLTAIAARPEFQSLLALASNPGTMEALGRLLKHADLLAYAVETLDALLRRSDTLVENLRAVLSEVGANTPGASESLLTLLETLHNQRDYLPRLIAVVPQFTEIIEQIGPFVASPEFRALLSSGIFHPDTVTLLGQAGDSFVATYDAQRKVGDKLGPLGILRALSDPEIQRVAALLMAFGRRFGGELGTTPRR